MAAPAIKMPDSFIYEELDGDLKRNRNVIDKVLNTDRVESPTFDLGLLASRAFEQLGLLILKGEAGTQEAGQVLGIAGRADGYALRLANYPEGEREIEVLIPPRAEGFGRLTTGPVSTVSCDRWFRAFYLNLIWDEPGTLSMLMLTRYETLSGSSTKSPAYRYLQVEAAKALYEQRPDAGDKIVEAMDAAEHLPDADKEFAAYVALHECGMMGMIALHDEDGFNREVEAALISHVKYYERYDVRRNRPEAWFCLPALGLSALAMRRGMNVTAKSPYLPLELI